jgi:hypothetical protein
MAEFYNCNVIATDRILAMAIQKHKMWSFVSVSFKIFSKENSTVNGPNVAETNTIKAMIFCSIFCGAPFGYLYVQFLFNIIASNIASIYLV